MTFRAISSWSLRMTDRIVLLSSSEPLSIALIDELIKLLSSLESVVARPDDSINVAGILQNGDVTACLDIPRNEKSIQGNVYEDSFSDIWRNRFEIYRTSLAERNEDCSKCSVKKWCRGGAYHSWDYENEKQKVCMKGILFDE